jgi:exodeoxyribonuclease-5
MHVDYESILRGEDPFGFRLFEPAPREPAFPFTSDQTSAIEAAVDYCLYPTKPYFSIAGYAGVGKSVVLREIQERLSERGRSVCATAYTGKAVSVLSTKGLRNTSTIHSLLYVPRRNPDGSVHWEKRESIPYDSTLVDEGSMVPRWIHHDNISMGAAVVYAGDPAQLKPVRGDDARIFENPDILMTQVHRQAENSNILRLAHMVREGKRIKGYSAVEGASFCPPDVFWADCRNPKWGMVICAKNRTRHRVNQMIRSARGFSGPSPMVGEKIVCLENDRNWGVFNGLGGKLLAITHRDGDRQGIARLDIEDDLGNVLNGLPAYLPQFGADKMRTPRSASRMQGSQQDSYDMDPGGGQPEVPEGVTLWDWAWCVTGHKAQGSEDDNVLVLEEIVGREGWDDRAWAYTMLTRARREVCYCHSRRAA